MSACFVCGSPIKQGARNFRRKVRTGEWERRGRGGARRGPFTVRFGMRVVCPWCARRIDREAARRELVQYAELGFALAFLALALLARFL